MDETDVLVDDHGDILEDDFSTLLNDEEHFQDTEFHSGLWNV